MGLLRLYSLMLGFAGLFLAECRWWLGIARSKLPNLQPNEFYYYLFMTSSCRYGGGCNFGEDPSGRICVLNKTEDINWDVWNTKMIPEINVSKALVKHT